MKVNVWLWGCDDATCFDMEVTQEEYKFLLKLQSLSEKVSTYQCMPTLKVEIVLD